MSHFYSSSVTSLHHSPEMHTPFVPEQGSERHHGTHLPEVLPYIRSSSRRAIACTTCAKAKTKCDKTVPSCSRCTAKGIICEPRSTRRTTDNNNKRISKSSVSKRNISTRPTHPMIRQHASPQARLVSHAHDMIRAASHFELHPAVTPQQQTMEYTTLGTLTPLQTCTPQFPNEHHLYSSSPGNHGDTFPCTPERPTRHHTELLTPQTPNSAPSAHNFPHNGIFTPQMGLPDWQHAATAPIGLGIEPGIAFQQDTVIWNPEFGAHSVPCILATEINPSLCISPEPCGAWHSLEMSNSASGPPHARAVPSLSFSENSAQDADLWNGHQQQWHDFEELHVPGQVPYPSPDMSVVGVHGLPPLAMSHLGWEVA